MWKKLKDLNYFLIFTDKFEVHVTDFITIWSKQFTNCSFLTCLLESNFGLEQDDINEEILQIGKNMLQNPDCHDSVCVSENGETLIVSMTVKDDCPLRLNLKLKEGSKEIFFQKVTQQLLKTVADLKSSENELRRTLLRNDKEIELAMNESASVLMDTFYESCFGKLKPVPFNDEVHTLKHKAYNDNFGSSILPESLLTRPVDVPASTIKPETSSIVKEEPIEEKPVIKLESQVNIKTEIKFEPKSESQSSTVSPSKKLRKALKY